MKPRIRLPRSLATRPFTAQEAAAAGLGRKRLRGADISRPFRGVYVQGPPNFEIEYLARSLQQRLPEYSFFCGITAAVIMSIPLPWRLTEPRLVHVAVPPPHRAPTGRLVRGHTLDIDPRDLRMWGPLRITTPERVWCDLGSLLSLDDLVAAGDYLIHQDLAITTKAALAEALARYRSRRGIRNLNAALPYLVTTSESPQESKLRLIVIRAGIPGLVPNHEIRTSTGYDYRGDLTIPSRKLIIEYQSNYHEAPAQFRKDMTRISRLNADGWEVMQVNKDDLDNAVELVARIFRVLEARPMFE